MADHTVDEVQEDLRISASASRRIAALIAQDGGQGMLFRVSVSGGGCSGFQYGFSLDDQRNEDDHVFNRDGVGVVVDDVSLDLLRGAEVDFVEDLIGSYFSIRNPNATSTCGCGSSFSL